MATRIRNMMIKAWRKRYKIIVDKVYKEKDVKSAINKKLMRPGRLIGYRAMHLKFKNQRPS